jgi:N6-adenosine-specific RNA methylase IME4
MGRPPKKSTGAMSDAERARAYRAKHGRRISRARKKQRTDAKKGAKRAPDTAQRTAHEAEVVASADHASAQLAKADRKFAFILADPMGGQGRVAPSRRMTIEAICAIRVPAADDAVLWLWSTRPLLIKAPHKIIPAWGFEDSTNWAWEKTDQDDEELKSGAGLVLRDQHEILIHCTRGKGVKPAAWSEQPGSVIKAPRPRLPGMNRPWPSRKPMFVHLMAEKYYPNCAKLEMFAWPPFRRGWHVMGDEVPGGYMTPEEAERAGYVGEW